MADHYSLCLLTVMDRLWFHQIILFSSDNSSLLIPKTLNLQNPLSTLSLPSPQEQEILSSPPPPQHQPTNLELVKEDDNKDVKQEERRTGLNLSMIRGRSQSSSLLTTVEVLPKNIIIRRSSSLRKLEKSMSCRSLGELELEEVKGFMDLGFIFKKEHINPRIVSVVPGLSRLGLLKNKHSQVVSEAEEEEEEDDDDIIKDDEEEDKGIIRPYLSEAWLIKRPDSPLLNLKLPRVYAASDMKKHLKFWARTVASVIQQES